MGAQAHRRRMPSILAAAEAVLVALAKRERNTVRVENICRSAKRGLTAALLAVSTVTVLTLGTQAGGPRPPEVTIRSGQLVGQYLGRDNDVAAYFGVPYAKPPVGNLRFLPPQPLVALPTRPFLATNNSIACEQAAATVAYTPAPVLSEDCLILNVWGPREPAPGRRPVMVWIHGGGNVSGNSNPYKGIEAVERAGIVLVTVNYRLGSFGYLALPGLDAINANGSSGNQAVQDLILALQWIRDNIEAFGGDPRNVTMFGVSAGTDMNTALLGAPQAAGLFHKLIMESLVGTGVNNTTRAQAETNVMNSIHTLDTNATNPLGCLAQEGNPATLLACLQALPASQALRIASPGEIIDGVTVPLFSTTALTNGQFNHVPMIIGSNQTEGTFFSNVTRTEAQYATMLSGLFPVSKYGATTAAALVSYVENTLYPSSAFPTPDFPSGSPSLAAAIVTGDNGVVCNAERVRSLVAPFVSVRGYEFAQPNPVEQVRQTPAAGIVFNDGHTTEVAYDFFIDSTGAPLTGQGTTGLPAGDPAQWGNGTHHDAALSRKMIAYWTAFAWEPAPDFRPLDMRHFFFEPRPFLPHWPEYTAAKPMVQLLINNSVNSERHELGPESDFVQRHNCDFWANPVVSTGHPGNHLIAPSGPN
jgi:para-nitrobenzyl esterase